MNSTTKTFTAEELLKMPQDGFRYELVKGELRKMSPAGNQHGKLAMELGASLWGLSNQSNDGGLAISKTRHIGVRYGYQNLKWNPKSPIFPQAGGSGLTVRSFQDMIMVNQKGQRFWN